MKTLTHKGKLWLIISIIEILIILALLIACTENYSINSTCKDSLIVGLYYSIHYEIDSTYAFFAEKSVFIGIGVYARTHDISREYREFTVTGEDTIRLIINNLNYYLRKI